MPSLVVHLALAGLLAAGLLGNDFGWRSLGVVLAATAFADLDVFVGLFLQGGHRSAFHTLLLPLAAGGFLVYDVRIGDRSSLRERFGAGAPRVAGVTVVIYTFAAIGLDLATGGANAFYPLHNQFYKVNGRIILSNQRGLVQTFIDLGSGGSAGPKSLGSTAEVHVGSGVDPTPGNEPKNVERIFPVVQTGWQLLLVLTSFIVVGGRFREKK